MKTSDKPIEIELISSPDINSYKQFSEARRMMFSLIPKNRQDLLFNGLTSKLEEAIRLFIYDEMSKKSAKLEADMQDVLDNKDSRIKELEDLCEKHNIKHTITREDIYGKRGDHFCND